ncbi:MAG: hypothetical protein KAT77_02115 [Nanoarchaeota archaeon]|nr:hypothetical protein [Nanoarchaeota archaeon]
MQKRGQTLTLKPIIEIVIAVSVVAFLMALGVAFGGHEIFQQERAARDGALLVNDLYTYPMNAWVKYPYNVSKYSFDFWDNHVKVLRGREDLAPGTHGHVKKWEDKQLAIDEKENFYLFVNNKEFGVSESLPALNKFHCEGTRDKLRNQEILFEIEEKFELAVIRIRSKFYEKTTLGCRGCSGISSINAESVNIKLESGENGKFKAYFYYDSEESRDLGCFILNELLDEFPGVKASLIPSDKLEEGKTSLILKFGDESAERIGEALVKGFEEYYET